MSIEYDNHLLFCLPIYILIHSQADDEANGIPIKRHLECWQQTRCVAEFQMTETIFSVICADCRTHKLRHQLCLNPL